MDYSCFIINMDKRYIHENSFRHDDYPSDHNYEQDLDVKAHH